MAECEHQFETIKKAQKILVAREMMQKLEIIVNEMMADDAPVPMDLGNVGAYDAKTTQSGSDTSNDMSYEDVCATCLERIQSRQGSRQEGTEWIGNMASWERSS